VDNSVDNLRSVVYDLQKLSPNFVLQVVAVSVVSCKLRVSKKGKLMKLFQVNISKTATSGKTAHYYKMSDYNVVIHKMQEMLRNGEIFDFEVIA